MRSGHHARAYECLRTSNEGTKVEENRPGRQPDLDLMEVVRGRLRWEQRLRGQSGWPL